MKPADFKPGLYRHHTGHFYRAMFLAGHHETGVLMVVYVPYGYPESGFRLREWAEPGCASWTDRIGHTHGPESKHWINPEKCAVPTQQRRFDWVGP